MWLLSFGELVPPSGGGGEVLFWTITTLRIWIVQAKNSLTHNRCVTHLYHIALFMFNYATDQLLCKMIFITTKCVLNFVHFFPYGSYKVDFGVIVG